MATFRDLLHYFQPYRAIAFTSIAANSVLEIIDLYVPYAIGQLLDILAGGHGDPFSRTLVQGVTTLLGLSPSKTVTILVFLSTIFIVTVVRAPIQPWVGLWFDWAIPLRARRDYSQRVVQKILSLPLEFYDENNPGRIAGRVARGLHNHTWTYPQIAGQVIPKILRVLGIFGVICWFEWRIALIFLLSFIVILFFSIRELGRIIKKETALDKYMENTESHTSEIITNIKTVKAFATESNELKRQQRRLNREWIVTTHRVHRGYVTLYTWQQTVIQVCVFGILGLTLAATLSGQMSLGHFITTLTLSSMAYAELEPISDSAEMFARRYSSMIRFHDFLQEPTGLEGDRFLDSEAAELETAVPSYQFTGKLDFSHVSFGYERDRPVLQDINLMIEPYQTVALVGRSGSGKSTLVKLLFRYFDPVTGCIRIDGQDIRDLNTTAYRRRFAIVHQEVDVFNGTLLENLTYGNPQATPAQIASACQIAQVAEFIERLPNGYQTVVGERGVRLSGGQRQRLGIARALLVDPDVLVFDEATSSLDYESERSIQRAMKQILGTRTTLIIAHRLSTVRDADKIVVLDQGHIVEVGNHGELIAQGGIYQRLQHLQDSGLTLD